MKAPLVKISFLGLAIVSFSMIVSSCSEQEENFLEKGKDKIEETPKSEKGNWIESDAEKFLADVSMAMDGYQEIFNEEVREQIVSCYLNKAILEFENYEEANSNPDKCKELASSCVNELVRPEDATLTELPEESVSEEKVKEITNNIDEILKDKLPK